MKRIYGRGHTEPDDDAVKLMRIDLTQFRTGQRMIVLLETRSVSPCMEGEMFSACILSNNATKPTGKSYSTIQEAIDNIAKVPMRNMRGAAGGLAKFHIDGTASLLCTMDERGLWRLSSQLHSKIMNDGLIIDTDSNLRMKKLMLMDGVEVDTSTLDLDDVVLPTEETFKETKKFKFKKTPLAQPKENVETRAKPIYSPQNDKPERAFRQYNYGRFARDFDELPFSDSLIKSEDLKKTKKKKEGAYKIGSSGLSEYLHQFDGTVDDNATVGYEVATQNGEIMTVELSTDETIVATKTKTFT